MLNSDQQKALNSIKQWWTGNKFYMVLEGSGGTGKTFLLDQVLKELKNCSPLILAPTHEALKQLKDKISGDYPFKTIHSALGISPTFHEKDLKFEQQNLPSLWEDVNLCVLDEASMVDDWILDILLEIGINILFVGHSAQLPPIKKTRLTNDNCISPVFEKGFQTVSLKQPMRNTGELWEFNKLLEESIYTRHFDIPKTFDIKSTELQKYLKDKQTIQSFLDNKIKLVLWSNNGVDGQNIKLRKLIHGDIAQKYKYLPGDLVILTAPMTVLDTLGDLDRLNDGILKKQGAKKSSEQSFLYSNTKGTVISCIEIEVHLNKNLTIPCHKIKISTDEGEFYLFEPIYEKDYERINIYYEHAAWNAGNQAAKQKAFKIKHFINSCFARVKHYFAATAHRLQGASIENVVVMDSDIRKNMCWVESNKCRYVACSRSVNNLMLYRGL